MLTENNRKLLEIGVAYATTGATTGGRLPEREGSFINEANLTVCRGILKSGSEFWF